MSKIPKVKSIDELKAYGRRAHLELGYAISDPIKMARALKDISAVFDRNPFIARISRKHPSKDLK